MKHALTFCIASIYLAGPASADWCDPPVAPPPTTSAMAEDFTSEFKSEFDQYFIDASRYVTCLDAERVRIFDEMRSTVTRYDRFLRDIDEGVLTE